MIRCKSIYATLALLLASGLATAVPEGQPGLLHAYVIVGEDGKAWARAVTSNDRCPDIRIDAAPAVAMSLRSAAVRVKNRGIAQSESKDADFPVSVCEAALPAGAATISVAGTRLPVVSVKPQRILIIGDTGCRIKTSESAFQQCNDAEFWPFEVISKQAAAWRPDLVVHLGDFHYRESPCPAANAGCAGSPWGFGYDAWNADFFRPARALLEAAPWVVVRGNHETCARAGQGWFRFVDAARFDSGRSCDDPKQDLESDFSAPYAVPIAPDSQLIVFDSAKSGGKPYAPTDEAYLRYAAQLRRVDELARNKAQNFFLSHHPVLGFASGRDGRPLPGDRALQALMAVQHPQRLFPNGVNLALHGHVHLFEAIGFKSDHPAVFVVGNSGSDLYTPLPAALLPTDQPAPGAVVDEFFSHVEFGYLTLERTGDQWKFTSWDRHGKALLRCELVGAKMHCVAAER